MVNGERLGCDQGFVEVGVGWSFCLKSQVEPQVVTLAGPLCIAAGETRLIFSNCRSPSHAPARTHALEGSMLKRADVPAC